MDTSSFNIPINMIRQYCFCPRIIFYHLVLGLKVTYPGWVKAGEEYHHKQKRLNQRRELSKFNVNVETAILKHDVHLEHSAYPFYGICDAIIEDENEVIPIEFKISSAVPTQSQKMQLVAYGMLAELVFNKNCSRGYILSGPKAKVKVVMINDENKNKVKDICDKISKIIDNESLPHSSASGTQCIQCEFLNHCNDRF